MSYQDADFFKELLAMFKLECQEHLESIDTGMKKLAESPPEDERVETLETVFRAAHSLKGAARTVGQADLEPIGQSLEYTFAKLKQKDIKTSTEIFNDLSSILHEIVTKLSALLVTLNEEGKLEGDKMEVMRLIDEVNGKIGLMGE